ncbi:MAG: hypothetical protein LC776_19720 [Acidobacteria bacterium]|nr:hypothetical protein [Acidobacteriota bacterium]
MSDLLRDDEQRIRLGERAQALVREQFSIEAVVDSLETTYNSILSERSSITRWGTLSSRLAVDEYPR